MHTTSKNAKPPNKCVQAITDKKRMPMHFNRLRHSGKTKLCLRSLSVYIFVY